MAFRLEVESVSEALVQTAVSLLVHGLWTAPVTDPSSTGSRFGEEPRRTLEVVGASLVVTSPTDRLSSLQSHSHSAGFALANALWTMRGSRASSDILPYNPRGEPFVDSSGEFAGAMGARIVRGYGDATALDSVVRLLESHPSSRRAMGPILDIDDVRRQPRDFPCAVATQYLLRDNRLEAITYMRSQSVVGLLYYDLFLFTLLQECVAVELGVAPGNYTHHVGSLHVYEDELVQLEALAREKPRGGELPARMTTTPIRDSRILKAEAELRSVVAEGGTCPAVLELDLPVGWRHAFALLELRLRAVSGSVVSRESALYDLLDEAGIDRTAI